MDTTNTTVQAIPESFAVGLALGVLIGTGLAAVIWWIIPATFWWAHDLLVRLAQRPTVDELLDLDRCDICLVVLTEDIEAITCDAHRYCGDCDDHSNRCTACAYRRRMVLTEERA